MSEKSSFKVIFAGGGIAGLTLANSLSRANIDNILLEARDEIAPQVGAFNRHISAGRPDLRSAGNV
jgi:2-polyprenyl-6-methoxyphenol hydroxylase-like FAD-dependent oxidoreductase